MLHCDLSFWPLDFPYCSVENWIEKVMEGKKSFSTERRWENAPFSFDSFFQQWILWLNCQIKDLTRSSMTSQNWSTNFSFFPRKRKRKLIENTIKSVLTRSKVDVTLESIKGELSCKSSGEDLRGFFSHKSSRRESLKITNQLDQFWVTFQNRDHTVSGL